LKFGNDNQTFETVINLLITLPSLLVFV